MADTFVHLHNHTEYSLLDGAVHIKDLIAECSRMGMPAVAVTDHGNLFGAIELVMEANSLNKSVEAWNKEHPEGPRKQTVKPIFGCEVYLSPTPISVKKQLPGRRKYTHLLLLADNDVHFLKREDHDMHDALICIGTNEKLASPKRMRYSTEVYLKSPEEMRKVFKDYPDALENTLKIAERCNVTIKLDSTSTEKYPEFGTPDGSTREEYLRTGATRVWKNGTAKSA